MSSDKYDYKFNLLTIGDSCADKAEFILRFTNDLYIPYIPKSYVTTGIYFEPKIIDFENKCIKLHIWNSLGEERVRIMTKTQLIGTHGVILIYDITDRNSFESVRNRMIQIELIADKSLKRVLIGNKCDEPNREVSEEDGKQLADEYNIGFFETSAKTGKNVNEIFYYLVEEILKDYELIKKEKIKLSNKNDKNKKNECAN